MTNQELNTINDYISSIIPQFVDSLGIKFTEKEQGHKFYQIAEDFICEKLALKFDSNIPKSARDIADVYVFNTPVNVKFGIGEKNGRPNMVSMNRLIALSSKSEDAQYIMLKIKVKSEADISVSTMDVLSNLHLISYNAGPGQTMLKEEDYYQEILSGGDFKFGVSKLERNKQLEFMYLDGLEKLQINRDEKKKKNLKLLGK